MVMERNTIKIKFLKKSTANDIFIQHWLRGGSDVKWPITHSALITQPFNLGAS